MASENDLILRSEQSSRLEGRTGGTPAEARVCLAVIGAPHGVQGAVRIKSFTDEPEAVARYGALEDEAGERQFKLQVIGAAKGDGMVIAKLSGIADRDRAATLRGLRLYLPRAALPPPGEDEFYYADLVGLADELLLEEASVPVPEPLSELEDEFDGHEPVAATVAVEPASLGVSSQPEPIRAWVLETAALLVGAGRGARQSVADTEHEREAQSA